MAEQQELPQEDKIRLEGMEKIAKAAHGKKIDAFVSIGTSAKPISLLFRHVWKTLYPKEPVPKMFSLGRMLDPKGIANINGILADVLLQKKPGLKYFLGKKIMLFDEVTDLGGTMEKAKRFFKTAGAKDITTAALVSLHKNRNNVDIIGFQDILILHEIVTFYKARMHLKNPRWRTDGGIARDAHKNLKAFRAHLKALGKRAR